MNFNVVERHKGRLWVVRADSGTYYDHFIKYGVVALGHIDELSLQEYDRKEFSHGLGGLYEKMQNKLDPDGRKKATISNHFNQVSNFVTNISINDWIITVGRDYIRFGTVTSEAYCSEQALNIFNSTTERTHRMRMKLRRRVTWGPQLFRKDLPFALLSSLKANQTLFNVDNHWRAIHHTLFPIFVDEGKVYLSVKIKQEKDINNYHVTKFFHCLNEIELLANCIGDPELTVSNFNRYFDNYAEEVGFKLTTKANFHSKGDAWAMLTGPSARVLVAFKVMLENGFDSDHEENDDEINELIKLAKSRKQSGGIEEVKDKLGLDVPKNDCSKLLQENEDPPQYI